MIQDHETAAHVSWRVAREDCPCRAASDPGNRMSKPARKSRVTQQLELLALRTLKLADQVAAGQLKFIDAVDAAYESANARRPI